MTAVLNKSPSVTSGKHTLMWLVFCALTAAIFCDSGVAQIDRHDAPLRRNTKSEIVNEGLVFLNGKALAPPYEIRNENGAVTINGFAIKVDKSIDSADVETDDGIGRRRRNGGPGRFGRADRNTDSAKQRDQFVDHLSIALELDQIVVAFDGQTTSIVETGSETYDFTTALLASEPTVREQANFEALAYDDAARREWTQWLSQGQLTEKTKLELALRKKAVEDTASENQQMIAAVKRMHSLNYPLTMAGMLLGVLGLGHMLKWAAGGVSNDEGAADSSRAVEKALLLILAMSAIDLIWTVLAGQAGAMTELNPIAASMMDSPAKLALFKLLATGCGIGILYTWRHRSQMQQATWWMCLVCVLLTFRWVMFDSMMS